MLKVFVPQRLDNDYRGRKLALWIFGVVVAVKLLQCFVVIFDSRNVARTADGIPLDSYPAAAAQTIVSLFMLGALSRLVVFLLCLLVLVRYRSGVPFMFGVLVLDFAAKTAALRLHPIVRVGTPAGPIVNLILFGLMVVGLALSLWNRSSTDGAARGTGGV